MAAARRASLTVAVLGLAALVAPLSLAARERPCRACDGPDRGLQGDEDDGEGFSGPIPFGWDDRQGPPASDNPPYPQGFVLTYTVRHDEQGHQPARLLNRYAEVGQALAGCWSAAAITQTDWRAMTLRVSLKRNGSINGVPVIAALDAPGDAATLAHLRTTVLSTLGGCAPLPLSPSLGAAIAGQIFSIRFIQAKDT